MARRSEDPRLLAGHGRYVDDLRLPGMVHARFVRSQEAHALVADIDAGAAAGIAGLVGVFTGGDLGLDRAMPNLHASPQIAFEALARPLAGVEVCHVGEPMVAVVAEDGASAADAAEQVFVDLEPLPAVADPVKALEESAPLVHRGAPGNLAARLRASYGDVDEEFALAPHRVQVSLHQHRGAGISIEPRGVVARLDPASERLVVWSSTQSPYALRAGLAEYLGLPSDRVRVVAPDVGGGFGPKAAVYAEEYVVAALALRTGRPVKWIETRREHFVATFQQRDQVCDLEVAFDGDGRLRGLRGRVVHDAGAYVPYGLLGAVTGLRLLPGPYLVPALDVVMDVAYTNLTPTSPVRGAGRPYAVFTMERVVDAVARELHLDPFEVRRRNFVPPDRFPYEPPPSRGDVRGAPYDGGDYGRALAMAEDLAERPGFAARRREAAAEGLLLGMGVASYVEDTGMPSSEAARVEVLPSGGVVVATGTASQGQGHATVLARVCARALTVDAASVSVRSADTDGFESGVSTVASRTAVAAGSSVLLAAGAVAEEARRRAARLLEARLDDLVLDDGAVHVIGDPTSRVTLAELATEAALVATEVFRVEAPAFAFGTHVAEVAVDPETGHIEVRRYVVVHDCGTVLDPMIVEGQIDGGVAHGLGNALLERLVFSEEGQPLVTTLMDYRITTAPDMPPLTKAHTATPSPTNPLGAKGAGEGGTLPVAAAVAAAAESALSAFGVVVDRHPLLPETVRRMLSGGGAPGA